MNLPKQETSNDGANHLNKYPSSRLTEEGLAADRVKYNVGKSGLSGFIKNPYVCFTAVFASIGGVLFGCKSNGFERVNYNTIDSR